MKNPFHPETVSNAPSSSRPRLLAQGEGWIAVSKPAGMSVHNDPERDLLSWVHSEIGSRSSAFAPAAIHRLDRETSGIVLFGTDRASAQRLAQAFEARDVNKTYVAAVRGTIQLQSGLWNWGLSSKAEGRKNPAGPTKDRKASETRFHVMTRSPYLTLIKIDLLTGRQHQIRRHAALAGHPVVGDTRYGDPRHLKVMTKIYGTNRLFLHAVKLDIARLGIHVTDPMPAEFNDLFSSEQTKDAT